MLKVDQLNIYINQESTSVHPVRDVSFQIEAGEIVAIIGESGSGKTQTAMAINQLNRSKGFTITGTIAYDDIPNIITLKDKALKDIRGSKIAYIDQEPMEALNPALKIGYQIKEVIRAHQKISNKEAQLQVESYLLKVGIKDVGRVYKAYPHQLSGGMQQRAAIAMALIGNPSLVIADEPTTALDVELERKILSLLIDIQKETLMSILIISHDLSIVEAFAHRTIVMYGGEIVEIIDHSHDNYLHPYTKALKECVPSIENPRDRLTVIEGSVFDLTQHIEGCHFYERCQQRMPVCKSKHPLLSNISKDHKVRCFLYE